MLLACLSHRKLSVSIPISSCCADAGLSIEPTSIKMSILIAMANEMLPNAFQYEKLIGPSFLIILGNRSPAAPQSKVPQSIITPPTVVP